MVKCKEKQMGSTEQFIKGRLKKERIFPSGLSEMTICKMTSGITSRKQEFETKRHHFPASEMAG